MVYNSFRWSLLFLWTGLVLVACSPATIVKRALEPTVDQLVASYMAEDDPELVEAAFPTNLKLLDALIAAHPDNTDLLVMGASAYTLYTYGFLMEKADRLILEDYAGGRKLYARSNRLFNRALGYGLQALTARYPQAEQDLAIHDPSVNPFTPADVPVLYWTAAALGGAISSSQGDPRWVIRLPEVVWLLECAEQLDPDWNEGSLYSALISVSLSRTDIPGQNEARARSYFQKALKATQGRDAGIYVTLAEKLAVRNQNREEFEQLLHTALALDVDQAPDRRLANVIAQRRARWLLDREDELFY